MILSSMHVNKTIAKVCLLLFKELYQIEYDFIAKAVWIMELEVSVVFRITIEKNYRFQVMIL